MDAETSFKPTLDANGKLFSCRYILAYLSFSGLFLLYASRGALNVALVDMVMASPHTEEVNDGNAYCPVQNIGNSTLSSNPSLTGNFNWTSGEQGLILGAFSWGYLITQIPGGFLATKGAGKWLFGLGVFIPGILNLWLPFCARQGALWVVFNRAFGGLFEAMMNPSISAMSGRWVPKYERSFYTSFVQSGSQMGNIITPPLVGFMCSLDFLGGWPICFYILGVLSIIWFMAWALLAYESPDQHPRISEAEKLFIVQNTTLPQKSPKVPWVKITTSRPVWGMCICFFCINWTNFGVSTCLPQYLSKVLDFNISTNGMLSGLPWVCVFVSMQFVSFTTDYMRRRKFISTSVIRKINQLLATVFPGIFLILAGYAGCNATLALVYVNLAMAFFAFNFSGFMCSHLDIAPAFAGVLYAISNTFGVIPALVAPIVVLNITSPDEHSVELWRKVFYMFAGLGVLGGAAFCALSSGELQPWAKPAENPNGNEKEKRCNCEQKGELTHISNVNDQRTSHTDIKFIP